MNGDLVHKVAPAALLDELGELLTILCLLPNDNRGPRIAVEHIPALALAKASPLVDGGILVIRVHLDREVSIGIEDLDQQRETIAPCITEQLMMLVPKLRERLARVRSAHDLAVTCGMRADGPALANGALGDVIVKDRVEPTTSPYLLVEDGLRENEILSHSGSLQHVLPALQTENGYAILHV